MLKLTDEQAEEIVRRYSAGGVLQRELAEEFGVTQSLVSMVVRGKFHVAPRRGPEFRGCVDERGRECSLCGDYKLWDAYSPHPDMKTGYLSACKDCRYVVSIAKQFGITAQELAWLAEQQGGKCALCFQVPETRLRVDHDHGCHPYGKGCRGCIRGLLCDHCNIALGHAEKSGGAIVLRFSDYLDSRPFREVSNSDGR